jgi:hypothetical protein
MHLKVFVKLKKTLKTLSSGQKTQKNPIKPKKPQKNKKTQKTPLGWFFFKTRVFSNPGINIRVETYFFFSKTYDLYGSERFFLLRRFSAGTVPFIVINLL